jgi:DNA-binding protein HU-beta
MHKHEIVDALASKLNIARQDAENFLEGFTSVVMDSLKSGQEVSISRFGVFSVQERHARMGVNPRNPQEKIQIPATRVVKFRAGKGLKESVK